MSGTRKTNAGKKGAKAPRLSPFATNTIVLALIGYFCIVVAWLHLGLPSPDHSIKDHHLQHLWFLIGGGLWGIALARWLARRRPVRDPQGAWLFPALLAPMTAMFLMWPSAYPYVEARPLLHASMHLVFVALGALTTFAGYQYTRVVGWLLGGSLAVMAWLAAFFFGVTAKPNPAVTAILDARPAPAPTASAEGQKVFDQICAACHMTTGAGLPGAFPPLAGHLPDLLAASGGRDYVVRVVLNGLQGTISIGGVTYNSVMPPWQQLSDQEIADALNYAATAWGNEFPEGAQAFEAGEVAAARGEPLGPQQVHELRGQLELP
ncbi:MAG: cytochrome c [Trueperaceae bacterium]|nr:cytochrome c [Trueperaceae bacterium]